MKLRTIGCVELNSISTGMHVADEMVKAAEVQLVLARPTCPGRYLVIVTGDTGAVKSSVAHGRAIGSDMVVDWFVIPSVHESVVPAMNGTAVCPRINALGCIETCTTAACIIAADAAAKAGQVHLIELRFAAGLGGKAFVTIDGQLCRRFNVYKVGTSGDISGIIFYSGDMQHIYRMDVDDNSIITELR